MSERTNARGIGMPAETLLTPPPRPLHVPAAFRQFGGIALLVALVGCVEGTCDTAGPFELMVTLSADDAAAVTDADGDLRYAKAKAICKVALRTDGPGASADFADVTVCEPNASAPIDCLMCEYVPGCKQEGLDRYF